MTTWNEVADLLDEAADEVSRDNGWCQGYLGYPGSADAPVCAVGAIRRVDIRRNQYGRAWQEGQAAQAAQAVRTHLALHGAFSIPRWNDEPGRTAGEVADAFRSTAKQLREQAQQGR